MYERTLTLIFDSSLTYILYILSPYQLATLYKDFYIEKAEYRKLVPEVTPASSSGSRQKGRVTRSSTGGVDANPQNPSLYINNTRSSKQKAIPTSVGDAIEVDLSSPERRQSGEGSRDARNIKKMNQRDDADSSEEESRRKEVEQDPSNAGNETITLVDSGSDSEDDSKRPDSVKPAPAMSVSWNAREGVAERNRRQLIENAKREAEEAAEAGVAAVSAAKFSGSDSGIDRDGKSDNVGNTPASVRAAQLDESYDKEENIEETGAIQDKEERLLVRSTDRISPIANEKKEIGNEGTVSSSSSEGTTETITTDAAGHVSGRVSAQPLKRPLNASQPVSSVNVSAPQNNSSTLQVSYSVACRRNSQNSLIELGNNSHPASSRHTDSDNGSASSSSSFSVAERGVSPPSKHLRSDSSSSSSSNDMGTSSSYCRNASSSNSNNNITYHSSSSSSSGSSSGNIPRRSGSALGNYENRETPDQRVPLPVQPRAFKSPLPTAVPTDNGLGSSGNKIDLTDDS